ASKLLLQGVPSSKCGNRALWPPDIEACSCSVTDTLRKFTPPRGTRHGIPKRSPGLPLEFYEDVAAESDLIRPRSGAESGNPNCGKHGKPGAAEARAVERPRAVQGGVEANLRPENYAFHKITFRNGRRDVEARRQAEIGGWHLDEGRVQKAPFGID